MAQGTGTDGFLARRAPYASARLILALAVALALMFSGCGGDSDSESMSAQPSSEDDVAKARGPSSERQASPARTMDREKGGDEGMITSPKATPGPSGSAEAGKQAPPIKLPTGTPESAPTPEQRAQLTVANMALTSAALVPAPGSASKLPPSYTCDGADSWPVMNWEGVPAGTEELALLAMNAQPIEGKLFFDWAVAGLDPSSSGLEAGRLPSGAITGRNSFGREGYSICPAGGTAETYIFALYALPAALSPKQGFDPRELRKTILRISGNVGLMAAAYVRR